MSLLDARLIGAVGLVLMLTTSLGCNVGPDSGFTDLQPLVFPSEGRLGDGSFGSTAAVIVDSNYMEGADDWEFHDLHKARVSILVSDPAPSPGWTDAPARVRQVFSMQTPPNSAISPTRPGAAMTVVVFDLPDQAALNSPVAPLTVLLKILIDGVLTYEPRFRVTGTGATPESFFDPSIFTGNINTWLQPQPTVRLRGKRLTGSFEPGMPSIAALDLYFLYDPACIATVRAYGATEATGATALVGPETNFFGETKYRHVSLFDPSGFDLAFLTDSGADQTLAGEGPLLDLAVDLQVGSGCTVSDPDVYGIIGLRAADVDGNWIFNIPTQIEIDTADAPSATALLRAYEVDLPAPAQSGGC
jgi:hypothetical protein